VSGTLCRRT